MFCEQCGSWLHATAKYCSRCGSPVRRGVKTESAVLADMLGIECPELPDDLSIGRAIKSLWPAVKFYEEYNPSWNHINANVYFSIHKCGIKVQFPGHQTDIQIHFSTLIDWLRYEDRSTLVKYRDRTKGPVGSAIVGGLLFGPLGAIVGAIAGTGSEQVKEKDFIVLHCWNPSTREPRSLLLCDDNADDKFRKFVDCANTHLAQYRYRNKTTWHFKRICSEEALGENREKTAQASGNIEHVLMVARPSMLRAHPILFSLYVVLSLVGIGLIVFILWKLKAWTTAITVTDIRTTFRRGLFRKRISEIAHCDAHNILVAQGRVQKLLGVGRVIVSSSMQASDMIDIKDIRHPYMVKWLVEGYRNS